MLRKRGLRFGKENQNVTYSIFVTTSLDLVHLHNATLHQRGGAEAWPRSKVQPAQEEMLNDIHWHAQNSK